MEQPTFPEGNQGTLITKPSSIVILFAICFSFWLVDFWRPVNIYNGENLFGDPEIFGRYSYLPALFLNDASFEWPASLNNQNPLNSQNKHLPKFSYGSALLDLPFFAIACIQAKYQGLPLDGFSTPFCNAIHWAGIFYALAGLFFLRKFLLMYFSEWVTALTLFLCLFGNLLFYYTFSMGELPQTQLFFLFSAFLMQTQRWHLAHKPIQILTCGITLALMSLIHFFEIYLILFFLLWNVSDTETFKNKFRLFKLHGKQLFFLVLPFLLLWLLQLLFDKNYSGKWFYDALPKEKYDFSDARINDLLFGFRYGWITYSPLMIFALLGIFFVKKQFSLSNGLLFFVTLMVLVVYSSWWDRSYGGYYGARRLVPTIAWLSVPLASLMSRVFQMEKINLFTFLVRLFFAGMIFSCVCFTFAQTYQVLHKRIVPSEMDGTRYWNTLRTFKFAEDK